MGSREDDEYWNTKYAEASCLYHDNDHMYYDEDAGEWVCVTCSEEDEINEVYLNG